MKNISDQYKLVVEGKLSESQFLRNTRLALPKFITNINSYEDTVKILKNKGIINEVKDEKINEYNPQQYNLGMRYELNKGTDKVKADKIVKKNLAANSAYYTNLHLAGYNEEVMKQSNKKRTDLPIEVKKDNFIDKANGVKTVKVDKLTEDELKILIGRILNESLEEASTSEIPIDGLTYEKATEIAGSNKFYIERNSDIKNTRFINNNDRFDLWKEELPTDDKLKTLTYKAYSNGSRIFRFTESNAVKKPDNNTSNDTGNDAVSDFLSAFPKAKYND
jgi:hypothetical protein